MAKNSIEEISKMNLADIEWDPDEEKNSRESESADAGQGGLQDVEKENAGPTGWDMQERMADPSGEHYSFDATIEKPELADFVRNHMTHSAAVIAIIVMGFVLPVYSYFVQRDKIYLALIFCLVLSFVYPVWQYKKIVDQNLKNPIYQNVFHYMVDEKGFHLEAGLRAIDLDWKEFSRLKELKSSYILYTGKKNAYIFPKKDLGANEERIMSFVRRRTGL